jgi:hypothetical protein
MSMERPPLPKELPCEMDTQPMELGYLRIQLARMSDSEPADHPTRPMALAEVRAQLRRMEQLERDASSTEPMELDELRAQLDRMAELETSPNETREPAPGLRLIPVRQVPADQIDRYAEDEAAAALLSSVDGHTTCDELVGIANIGQFQVFRLLAEWTREGVICFRPQQDLGGAR